MALTQEDVLQGFRVEICPPRGGRAEEMTAKQIERKMEEALRLIRANRYFSGALERLEAKGDLVGGYVWDLGAARNRQSLVELLDPFPREGAEAKAAARACRELARELGTLRGEIGASKEAIMDVLRNLPWEGEPRRVDREGLERLREAALGEFGPLIRAERERERMEEAVGEAKASKAPGRRGM